VPRKLIIDVDPGIGDALAIVTALLDPELDVTALTAVAGRVTARDATRNLQAVVEQLDPPKWPRIGAASQRHSNREMLPGDDLKDLELVNGPTGLGDWEFPVAELHHRHESAKLMTDQVKAEPNTLTVLTLGPLTNVAAASERQPEFLDQVVRLVCLGGSVSAGGDITPAAEFNVFIDPESAHAVLLSPATKTLVPLDVSRRVVLTLETLKRLPSQHTRAGGFLQQLLSYSFRAHHQYLGVEGIPLPEIVALAAISRPQLFRTEMMTIDVEVRGHLTQGMTVFDRRPSRVRTANIEVVTDVDAQGVLDYLVECLHRIDEL